MNMHKSPLPPPDDLSSLAQRLRSLPPPAVPDDLHAALVSAIPLRAAPVAVVRAKARWLITGGMVAAVVATVLFASHARQDRVAQRPSSRKLLTTPPVAAPRAHVDPQQSNPKNPNPEETDPCNILPPLGSWR